jgi:hypothetical protein
MRHARHQRRLSEYLDGALVGRAKQRVDQHLARCEKCRAELAELRGTVSLLKSLAEDPPETSEFLATRVIARIEAGDAAPSGWERARESARWVLSGPWAPAFASVAVLFVVATVLRVEIDVRLPDPEASARTPALAAATAPPPASAPELELAPVPTQSRRRFEPVVLEQASGVQRACAASPHDADCAGFRNKLVNLALGAPPEFVREIESFPPESRDRVLSAVSLEAARTGHAQRVITRLRGVEDPRVVGIVIRFQRSVASRE